MENYKIIKYLNQGSYGKIYLVEKKSTGKLYALKSIKIMGIDRYNKVSILNEIKILLMNQNEYLLKCYDLFINNKKLCIITEYVDGGDLENYTKKRRLKEEEVIKIFLKICVGINSLHHNHIIHRDIKPANILITKEGQIKICDFGICKFLDYNKVTNTSIGTPFFMSPEQMTQQYYDYKIDVWGIGCVLFYLVYNKYPFNGNNMHQLKSNIRYLNPFSNIRTKVPFISHNNRFRLEQILREMFEKNKQKRMDLNLFLENSKELLAFYNIENNKEKCKQYHFKSVPNTERDWKNIIKKVYEDFELPNSPRKNKTEKIIPKIAEKPENQPEIKTYAEIKNRKYNISPMEELPPPQIPVPTKKIPVPTKKIYNPIQHYYPKLNPPIRAMPKIYSYPQRQAYVSDLHRIQAEQKIKERYKRIEAQNKCINENRNIRKNIQQPQRQPLQRQPLQRYPLQRQKTKQQNMLPSQQQKNNFINNKKNMLSKNKTKLYHYQNNNLAEKIINMKNRIKNVESKIKHIWAPPKK